MKRNAAIAAIILAVATTALSCNGAKKPADGAGGSIKVLNWGTEQEGQVWEALAKDFTAETGIQVETETAEWEVYWDKINTLYAAGTPPEVFGMDAPLFQDWYSRGALAPLKPYMDKEPGILEGIFPQTLKAYETPEGYFGLPRDFQTIVLFYNKDMFDAALVKYPTADWTYEDFRAAAKKLTRRGADGHFEQWGAQLDLWDIELIMSPIVWAYGGDVIDIAKGKTLIADKMEPWSLIRAMIVEDKSIPDQDALTQYGLDAFFAGKAAMIFSGHWSVPTYKEAPFKWDVAPMPKGPAGRATSVNSAGFVMAKNSANPDAGWKWIKFVLSEKGQTQLARLGFAIPVRESIAKSPAYLEQEIKIDHRIFLDSLADAHMKPVFKGYDAWSSAFGDSMTAIWKTDVPLQAVLSDATKAADEALSEAGK